MEFIRKFDKKVFWCPAIRSSPIPLCDCYLNSIATLICRISGILSTGGCLPQCMLGYTQSPWADTPVLGRPPPDRHPLASVHAGIHKPPGQIPSLGRHRPGHTTPWADNPLGRHPLLGIHPLGIHPPGQTPPTQTSPVARHPLPSAWWDTPPVQCILG